MTHRRWALWLAVGLLWPWRAEARHAAGTEAVPWLKINPDAAQAALGQTGVARRGVGFPLMVNPALLGASGEHASAAAGHLQAFEGMTGTHGAASVNLGTWALGAQVGTWAAESSPATDAQGREIGSTRFSAQSVSAGLAHREGDWRWGLAGKTFQEDLGGGSHASRRQGWAGDVGAFWRHPYDPWSVGASLTNVGGSVKNATGGNPLPWTARLGAEVSWLGHQVHTTLELAAQKGEAISSRLGLGYQPWSNLSLRLGEATDPSQNNWTGWTAGVGLKISDVELNYAYAPDDNLGLSQRASLAWEW